MKFPFSMWNYNRFSDFGRVGDADMDELAVWTRCGLTVPCLPCSSCRETDPSERRSSKGAVTDLRHGIRQIYLLYTLPPAGG